MSSARPVKLTAAVSTSTVHSAIVWPVPGPVPTTGAGVSWQPVGLGFVPAASLQLACTCTFRLDHVPGTYGVPPGCLVPAIVTAGGCVSTEKLPTAAAVFSAWSAACTEMFASPSVAALAVTG